MSNNSKKFLNEQIEKIIERDQSSAKGNKPDLGFAIQEINKLLAINKEDDVSKQAYRIGYLDALRDLSDQLTLSGTTAENDKVIKSAYQLLISLFDELQIIAKTGSEAVKNLRSQKLKSGHPFMINSRDLPSGECYMEYPDGTIKLLKISENGREFITIKELSTTESQRLRRKFHLIQYA